MLQVLNDLPKKVEELVYCDLVEKQRKYYDELVTKYKSLDCEFHCIVFELLSLIFIDSFNLLK